jgi:hypothetical protein
VLYLRVAWLLAAPALLLWEPQFHFWKQVVGTAVTSKPTLILLQLKQERDVYRHLIASGGDRSLLTKDA